MSTPLASEAIRERLENFRDKDRVQAGSLITSVFGDAILPRGGRVWLGSLIRLLQPLNISERLIRTAVFRLVKEEWLRTEAHGRRTDYMLTGSGRRRFEEAARHIYAADAPLWDRRWRLIMVIGNLEARQRERLRRALYWQGFGDTGAGCFIHPGVELSSAIDALVADGMSEVLPQLMPLLAVNPRIDQSASDADMVQRAWNLDDLAAAYAAFVARYRPVVEALRQDKTDSVDDEDAFLARTLLIHDFRRLMLRDPELPEVLLPSGWPGNHARALCKEIYRRLLGPSERHLDKCLQLADGSALQSGSPLNSRFQSADPLPSPS